MKKTIIREISYKGHTITQFEDALGQEFTIIDGDENRLLCSVSDAKRFINGEPLVWEVFKPSLE